MTSPRSAPNSQSHPNPFLTALQPHNTPALREISADVGSIPSAGCPHLHTGSFTTCTRQPSLPCHKRTLCHHLAPIPCAALTFRPWSSCLLRWGALPFLSESSQLLFAAVPNRDSQAPCGPGLANQRDGPVTQGRSFGDLVSLRVSPEAGLGVGKLVLELWEGLVGNTGRQRGCCCGWLGLSPEWPWEMLWNRPHGGPV